MEYNQNKDGFSYTYSAKEQEELKRIREKYTAPTESEDKMARLRRLDASVTDAAQVAALVLGIVGALILGCGMSLCMTDIGNVIGLSGSVAMIVGIIVGVLGGVMACLAYPVYQGIVSVRRKKIAPEIIRLTDELMK